MEFTGLEKTHESLTPSPSRERDREQSSPSPAATADVASGPKLALARMYRPNQELRIHAANSENVFIVHNEVIMRSTFIF